MADVEYTEAPPAGEEIHLPEPTVMPLVMAVGITLGLLGLTIHWILSVAGVITVLICLVRWIRLARTELNELPLEHR
jgi:hypothetical protein